MEALSTYIVSHRSALEACDLGILTAENGEASEGPGKELPRPISVLVPRRERMRRPPGIAISTTLIEPPSRDILEGNGIRVLCPEYAIAQMCDDLSLPRIIRIVSEACGTYRTPRKEAIGAYASAFPSAHVHTYPKDAGVEECDSATFYGIAPITTVERLREFVDGHAEVHGLGRLGRALPYCSNGLRSPMETFFLAQACLPGLYGGFGLPHPLVNARLPLGRRAANITGSPYLVADFLWREQKVTVEVLGATDHTGDGITETSKREKAYESMGYRCMTVTSHEVMTSAEMEFSACSLARMLRRRIRLRASHFDRRREWLRSELLASIPCSRSITDWRDLPTEEELRRVPLEAYGIE